MVIFRPVNAEVCEMAMQFNQAKERALEPPPIQTELTQHMAEVPPGATSLTQVSPTWT